MNDSPRRHFRRMLGLLGVILAALTGTPAQAVISCTPSMSPIAFGTVDPLSSLTNATGVLTYKCSNTGNQELAATLCFSVGEPGGGQTNPRRMASGNNRLSFHLYREPSKTTIWGSSFFGSNTPIKVDVNVPAHGAISTPSSSTVYGEVAAGQSSAVPGYYTDQEQAGDTALTINQNGTNTAPGSCAGSGSIAYFPLLISATVEKNCTVTARSASDIQIGAAGGVAADSAGHSGSGTISVTCSNTTPYYVGLTPLSNSSTVGAGVMSGTGANTDKVPYQLHSVSATGPAWGNTATSKSQGNGVAGTGTGFARSIAVFATAASANFTPDSYVDIVTVTVNY